MVCVVITGFTTGLDFGVSEGRVPLGAPLVMASSGGGVAGGSEPSVDGQEVESFLHAAGGGRGEVSTKQTAVYRCLLASDSFGGPNLLACSLHGYRRVFGACQLTLRWCVMSRFRRKRTKKPKQMLQAGLSSLNERCGSAAAAGSLPRRGEISQQLQRQELRKIPCRVPPLLTSPAFSASNSVRQEGWRWF